MQVSLGVVRGIKFFRSELHGRRFIVFTGDATVITILDQMEIRGRLARWIQTLAEYDFELQHRKGKDNVLAEFLSRTILKSSPIVDSSDSEGPGSLRCFMTKRTLNLTWDLEIENINQILSEKFFKDSESSEAITPQRKRQICKAYFLSEGILHHRWKGEILKVKSHSELREIVDRFHSTMGHYGSKSLFNVIRTRYYCQGLLPRIQEIIKTFHECQVFSKKNPKYCFTEHLKQSGLFDDLSTDYAGPFPEDQGNVYITAAIEGLSRWPFAEAVAAPDSITTTDFLITDIFPIIGFPKRIISDRGSHFVNHVVSYLIQRLHITEYIRLPLYVPEWNAIIERFFGTLQGALSKTVYRSLIVHAKPWSRHIPSVLFFYRIRPKEFAETYPFFLLFGKLPRITFEEALDFAQTLPVLWIARLNSLACGCQAATIN